MPDTIDDRAAVLARGDEMWESLRHALDARLHDPLGSSTDWTGHDVYAHFARWQALSIEHMRIVLAGSTPPPPEADDDTLNMRWRTEDRTLPTNVIVTRCDGTRQQLRDMLDELTPAQWEAFGRLFAADINGEHYEHHIAACAKELVR